MRRAGTFDQLPVESPIADEVQLKPERLADSLPHVLDGTDRHRAEAERHAELLGRTRPQHLSVCMKQPGQAGGADRQRNGRRLTQKRGVQRLLGHVHHDPLPKLQSPQATAIALQSHFVVRAAVGVLKNCAGDAGTGEIAEVRDAIESCHPAIIRSRRQNWRAPDGSRRRSFDNRSPGRRPPDRSPPRPARAPRPESGSRRS